MPSDRRQGRILAMQALCQWDVQRDASAEALDAVEESMEGSRRGAAYARTLVERFWAMRKGVDRRLTAASTEWSLSRISPVERNAMRVATVEMMGDVVPPKVAINEAIEIVRAYGGADSPKFVNGVLDAVLKTLERKRKESG